MTERMNTWQAIVSNWREQVVPEEHATPQEEFKRGIEEIRELREALSFYDGTPERAYAVGSEAIDVIIRMLGVVGAVGMDAERLMEDKVTTIYQKYNPTQHQELRSRGMSFPDAMRHQKQVFNSGRPNHNGNGNSHR